MTVSTARRLILVPVEPRRSGPKTEPAPRRYRLAHRRLDGPSRPERFQHLKRVYD